MWKACSTCGQDMETKAASCPHCGAPGRDINLWLMIIIWGVGIPAGMFVLWLISRW